MCSNTDNTCPFCNNNKINFIKNVHKNKLYNCNICELEFFYPRTFDTNVYEESKVGGIYEQYHKIRIRPTMWLNKMIKVVEQMQINFEGKRIIEIGSGDGLNYEFLKNKFPLKADQYEILELDKKSVAAAQKRGLKKCYTCFFDSLFANEHKAEFDIVIVTEVIEHQVDLKSFIDNLFQILAKDGIILMSTPNRNRPLGFIGEKTDMPPHHFLRFSTSFFKKNFSDSLFFHTYYNLNWSVIIDYSKAVSLSKFKTNRIWIPFVPVFIIKKFLSFITGEGEGHFLIFKKN